MAELSGCNKLCIFLLSVIGLWPYGSAKIRHFKNIFISVTVWLCVLAQIRALVTMEVTLYRLLRDLALITVTMGSLAKYHTVWYRANTVKGLLDRIKLHFQTNNDTILQIMQKYNCVGKQLSTILASCIYSVEGILILYHLSPIILDKSAPLNESRPIKYPMDIEFLFNKDRHPISATIVYFLWIAILGASFLGTESLTITVCLHAASLFEVTSYYFETAVSVEVTDSCIPRKHTNNKSTSYLTKSVFMHREAILFCSECDNYIKLSYTPLIILGVISLSINLFVLSQSVFHSTNVGDLLLFLMLVVGEVQYMFLINFAMQFAADGAANISISMYISWRVMDTAFFHHNIYNTSWYETSIATQKLLQMVILKSNQGFTFTFYNIFEASLRGFSVLFQTSVSYFAVLISLK